MAVTGRPLPSTARAYGEPQAWSWRGWPISVTHQPSRDPGSDSTPVVLLHGFGASIGHWRDNIPGLSAHRSVYGLDLLGFGGSAKPRVEYSFDLWVDQVHQFLQQQMSGPVILVGHSIGGLVAVLLAARYPEQVKGICLISCADGPHPEDLPQPFGWVVRGLTRAVVAILGCPFTYPLLFDRLRQRAVLRKWVEGVYKHRERVDEELLDIFLQPAFDPGADYVFLDTFRAILTRPFAAPKRLLPHMHTPILVIWGQEDPAVPSFLADRFKQWQPQLTLIKLPGVGHCAHDELPQWVNALIGEWVAHLETVPRFFNASTPRP